MSSSSNRGSNSGRGGNNANRGKGKKKNSQPTKKGSSKSKSSSTQSQKYKFSIEQSTLTERVASHSATFEHFLTYLMSPGVFDQYGVDVRDSCRDGNVIDFNTIQPTLRDSNITAAERAASAEQMQKGKNEDAALNAVFVNEMQVHMERQRYYNENMIRAYGILFTKYCDKSMQAKLKEQHDFDTGLKDQPVATLARIRELMHSVSSDPLTYPYAKLWSTMSELFTFKQDTNETMEVFAEKYSDYCNNISSDTSVLSS